MADTDINSRLVARIDRWLKLPGDKTRYSPDDKAVLTYIRSQITPEGLAARGEDDQIVSHLHEVARQRLVPYASMEVPST